MLSQSYFKEAPRKELSLRSLVIMGILGISALASFYIILRYNKKEEYQFLWALPVSYFIFSSLFYSVMGNNRFYKYGILYYLSNGVFYIRYIITPVAAIYTQYNRGWGRGGNEGWGPDPSVFATNEAIVLMILEMVSIYFAIIFSAMRNRDIQEEVKNEAKIEFFTNKFVVLLFIVASFLFVFAVAPEALSFQHFLTLDSDYQPAKIIFQFDGLVNLLLFTSKSALLLLVYSIFYRKYLVHCQLRYIFLSYLALFLYLGVSVSTSRWNMIFPAICSIVLFYRLYHSVPKLFNVIIIFILCFSVISISVYKFSWLLSDGTDYGFGNLLGTLFSQCQDYFSGPRLVAQSLEMKNMLGSHITLETFINDIIGNIPGIANFVDQNNRINSLFNFYYSGDYHQIFIMPMLGIGICYFPIFPPVFTVLCEYFMIKLDRISSETAVMEYKYAYLYFGLFLVMCAGFNTQIIFGHITSVFLPLLLLFFVNRRVSLVSQRNSKKSKYMIC